MWYNETMDILKSLNEEQMQALLSIDGANLVTAGAGTGKTRLLTHRIAYLIQELKVDPYNILAITFTNKAANEMKTRVEALVDGGNRVWISTFHSMCMRMLRRDIDKLGLNYDRNFTIYNDTDSEKVIKDILKEFNIEDEVKKFTFHISNCKSKNMTLYQYEKEFEGYREIGDIMRVFREYEKRLQSNNALDFDDLLTKTFELFIKCPDVLEFYSRRFEYVLVDEFQDTNKIQYDLTRLLTSTYKNLFVVGDEDQSIYSWRGADFTNIFNISKDYPGTKIFKLQQNYRCTKDILKVANKLISLNDERFDKKLWTNKQGEEKVSYKKYYDEQEEATSVASTIFSLVERYGYKYNDIAILVRLNALTLPFEEKLLSYNIPHKIYGGFKFFERAEIKNILAYLRIFVNPKDEVSLLRIINFPKRSIGDVAIASLKELARNHNENLLDVVLNIELYPEAKAMVNKIKSFSETYKSLKSELNVLSPDAFVEKVIDNFKIKEAFPKDNDENIDKQMNISQFVGSVKSFMENNPNCTISEYLESVTLQSDIDTLGDSDNVIVSTVHAVKGLEFKAVFVVGMESGVFPLSRCKENEKDLQEERRLAYVAFTRAEEKLFVSSCKTRFLYGRRNYQGESQFIEEAGLSSPKPKSLFNFGEYEEKPTFSSAYGSTTFNSSYNTKTNTYMPRPAFNSVITSEPKPLIDTSKYKVGQIVEHPKFGTGEIKAINDGGKTADINFGALGTKTLMLEIAKLTILL
ncbi:MAG: UvrD-helicase domain-containing protein [Clostridia bacterium]|nr:UvrD-helicase domain-containing protein [Clostridia bacterium]